MHVRSCLVSLMSTLVSDYKSYVTMCLTTTRLMWSIFILASTVICVFVFLAETYFDVYLLYLLTNEILIASN